MATPATMVSVIAQKCSTSVYMSLRMPAPAVIQMTSTAAATPASRASQPPHTSSMPPSALNWAAR